MQRARYLALALGLWANASPGLAAVEAGVAAAVRGRVTVDRSDAIGVQVESGTPIFLGDAVKTGEESGLQILLLDETVFTLGPNSELLIDAFVYDPGNQQGELDAELVRGAFRFISGRIAKHDPEAMKVRLPSGTIGIRGTVVDTAVDPDTGRSLVVLAAPGTDDVDAGAIRVANMGIGRDVKRGGWGVEIPSFTEPPTPPFLVPAELYDTFEFQVTSQPDAQEAERAEPGQSGERQSRGEASDRRPSGDRAAGERRGDERRAPQRGNATSREGAPPRERADRNAAPPPRSRDGAAGPYPPPPTGTYNPYRPPPDRGDTLDPFAPLGSDPTLIERFDGGLYAGLDPTGRELLLSGPTDPYFILFDPEDINTIQDMGGTITSVNELVQISTSFDGHFFYNAFDAPLLSGSGSNFDLLVDLDFSADVVAVQVLDVQSSALFLSGSGAGATSVPITSSPDLAQYSLSLSYRPAGCQSAGCLVPTDVSLTFGNKDGVIAKGVAASVVVGAGISLPPPDPSPTILIPRNGTPP